MHRVFSYNSPYYNQEWEFVCGKNTETIKKIIKSNLKGVSCILYYLLGDKRLTEYGIYIPGVICDDEFYEKLKKYVDHISEK